MAFLIAVVGLAIVLCLATICTWLGRIAKALGYKK